MGHYEENHEAGPRTGWAVLTFVCAGLLGFGLICFSLVKDRQRTWGFGALPDVPAQSIYSSVQSPPGDPVPRQFAALPEARPWRPDGGQ